MRWTARVLGTLLLGIYCLFVIGEGLPPIGSQPEGVQLSFVAVGLMLLGFVVGWKKEGTAALLIACCIGVPVPLPTRATTTVTVAAGSVTLDFVVTYPTAPRADRR